MHEETKGSKFVKWTLIIISVLFLFIMLILPLATVLTEALKSGWQVFWDAVSDEYTLKADECKAVSSHAFLFQKKFPDQFRSGIYLCPLPLILPRLV